MIGDEYKRVEHRILDAIHLRFSLPSSPPAALNRIIKQADRASAFFEATHLAGFSVAEAEKIFGRPQVAMRRMEALVAPMSSQDAEDLFLAKFAELDAQMESAAS